MNTRQNTNQQWQDQQALERFQMIAPLLQEDLDEARRLELRRKLAEEHGVSVRSLYRYEKSYREAAFEGLKPQSREKKQSSKLPENYQTIVSQAIQLRREVPGRSVNQIIAILELEGLAAPGTLARSTLERYLCEAGFGTKQLATYKEARESSSKRFCKPHRMMLVQGDIKYGPELKIDGKKVKTYLSSAIDDHSRFVLFSQFYDNQDESIVEDTFRNAILKYGTFDMCYFDNGSQYVARQLNFSLARLGIRVRRARPRSGKSKGKIEKFHQVVDAFLREVKLKRPASLSELNRYWQIYLEEYYHKRSHKGISEYYQSLGVSVPETGITPLQEFNRDSRALTYIDASVVAEAFLHHEDRRVDKGACISFRGQKYETKPSLIGFKVQISYDPAAPETLTVSYPGILPFQAHPVRIGAFCDKNPTLPVSMQPVEPETSRLLDALEKKQEESRAKQADAISFASYRKKGGANNV